MARFRLDVSPPLGPYCCFTGRPRGPAWRRYAPLPLVALALVVPGLGALHLVATAGPPTLGTGSVTLAAVLALALWLAASLEPRVRAAVAGLYAAASAALAWRTWNLDEPLARAEAPDWLTPIAVGLERAEETLRQTLGPHPFPLAMGLAAALFAWPAIAALIGAWRVAGLPKRLWFARHHPIWRRAYRLDERPFGLAGVLWVKRDPLLAEKLVFLRLERGADTLLLAPARDPRQPREPFVPLAGLTDRVALQLERGHWYLRGPLDAEAPAIPRLVLQDLHAPQARSPRHPLPSAVDRLPVRDLFASDNALYGKRYQRPPSVRLFGLLFDSRPQAAGPGADLPRFTVLLVADGRLRVEYAHPDLLPQARYDAERDTVLLTWRRIGGELQDLECEGGCDAVFTVQPADQSYHLLFMAFGGALR
jgi:hypothetical protein